MVERRILGGTCVNRGCRPSKNLIEAARIVHETAHPRYPNLTPAVIGVDLAALAAQKDAVVYEYRAKKYASVADSLDDLEILEGDAVFVDSHTVLIGGQEVTGDRLLVATGSRPAIPPIPGLGGVPYLTSDLLDADEADRLTDLPESLAILGGGYRHGPVGASVRNVSSSRPDARRTPTRSAWSRPESRSMVTASSRSTPS